MFTGLSTTKVIAGEVDSVVDLGGLLGYAIIRKVLDDGECSLDQFVKIPLSDIRKDPSWLKQEIEKNRTEDLLCFLNAEVFNAVIGNFIRDDWEPLCYDLLAKTVDLLVETTTTALAATISDSQSSKLCTLIEIRSADLIQSANQLAMTEIAAHLKMEMFPFTQDDELFVTIKKNRNKPLRVKLERCLLSEDKVPLSYDQTKAVLDGIFNRSENLLIDDHMAEEMEIILAAYGAVCFKRVTDKTPMICQKMFRDVSLGVAEVMQGITDSELDLVMQKEPDVTRRYEEAKAIVHEMDKAIIIFRELQTGLVG